MDDVVNHPKHYTWMKGIEAVDILEQVALASGWNVANAVKYLLRCDKKGKPVQDLKKVVWYIQREIENRERRASGNRPTLSDAITTGDSMCVQSAVFSSTCKDRNTIG